MGYVAETALCGCFQALRVEACSSMGPWRSDHRQSVQLPLPWFLCLTAAGLQAQTVVKLPKNKFTPEQDVKLGREAAAEVRQQYPVITDEKIVRYLPASAIDWSRRRRPS